MLEKLHLLLSVTSDKYQYTTCNIKSTHLICLFNNATKKNSSPKNRNASLKPVIRPDHLWTSLHPSSEISRLCGTHSTRLDLSSLYSQSWKHPHTLFITRIDISPIVSLCGAENTLIRTQFITENNECFKKEQIKTALQISQDFHKLLPAESTQ